LTAAIAVAFSHSFSIFPANTIQDPTKFFIKGDDAGTLSVYVFFFLSGIFITKSFVNSPSQLAFIINRLFRIWPALIVCIFMTVFIIGPVLTRLTLKAYFFDRGTWSYLINNCLIFNTKYYLPGVFELNRYQRAVNGSLWTLPLELTCYFVVLLIGSAIKYKINIVSVVLLVITLYSFNHLFLFLINKQSAVFIVGCIVYLVRKCIVIDYRIFIFIGLLLVVFNRSTYQAYVFYVFVLYGALVMGASSLLNKINLPGDYSYGVYIYAFLLQQIISYYQKNITPYEGFLLVLPFAFLFAALSWHFIEQPILKKAKVLISTKRV